MKVLFNNCYGAFCYSIAFIEEYKVRYPEHWKQFIKDTSFDAHQARSDPRAVALFEERGSEWSSGEGAMLELVTIPDVFADFWEIEEYDGNETVRILRSDALADILHTFINNGDEAALRSAYTRLMETDTALVSGIGVLDSMVI